MRLKSLVVLLFCAFPFVAQAGCESARKDLSIIDIQTEKVIQVISNGKRSDCVSAYLSSHRFKKDRFVVSSFVCSNHCKKGFTPNQTYIQTDKAWTPGKTEYKNGQFCLIPEESSVKYCWDE